MGQRQDCGTGVIYTHVAAAVLAGGIAFAGGWKVHAWKTGSEQATAIEAAAESARLKGSALLQSTARTDRETTARLRTAEAAALDARSDLDRLRNEAATVAAADPGSTGCADDGRLERESQDYSQRVRAWLKKAAGELIDLRQRKPGCNKTRPNSGACS